MKSTTATCLRPDMLRRRARGQMPGSDRFFSGWIVDATGSQVLFFSNAVWDLIPGDRLTVEVVGRQNVAHFRAVVTDAGSRMALLKVEGPVGYLDGAEEDARLLIAGVPVRVVFAESVFDGHLLDGSEKGAGVSLDVPLESGDRVELVLGTGVDGGLKGTVRYCRRYTDPVESYRIGIRLEEGEEPAWERWRRLINPETERES